MSTHRKHSIDLGNRFLKYRNGSQSAKMMLSICSDVVANRKPNVDFSNSADIHYLEGNPDYQGKRWIVGESARETPGYINTVSLSNKAEEALRLTLATVEPAHEKETELVLTPLYISVPDPDQDTPRLEKSLIGTHSILRNGHPLTITIKELKVVAEAAAGYAYAIQEQCLPKNRINGILDMGGGTVIGALFNPRGQEVRDARVVFRKSGAFDLANRIAADPNMRAIARGTAAIDKILDAIANGTYLYGTTGDSFQPIFEAHRPLWLKQIMNELISRWDGYLDDVSHIALIGGSAPLAEYLFNTPSNRWFRRCPNPQLANVLGLEASQKVTTGA